MTLRKGYNLFTGAEIDAEIANGVTGPTGATGATGPTGATGGTGPSFTGGTVSGATTFSNASITMSALPTVDPAVAGRLWANSGVVTVSAG